MAQPLMQKSFNTGEWAPQLYSRVDLEKYHGGAALLENFFVDYRGGASTRTGTQYILLGYNTTTAIRLIPFQASFSVAYILEFGNYYVRFYNNRAPVLENSFAISGATKASPCVITVTGNNYAVGDWIYITGVVGMTQLNGNYYYIAAVSGSSITLFNIGTGSSDSTGYGAYVSGGTASRVYTVATPYAASDLALVKFAQNVNTLILCHPDYVTYALTLITFNNWTMQPITVGTTAQTPTGLAATTTLTAGDANYSYVVTSLDSSGQESAPSAPVSLTSLQDLRSVPGSNQLTWDLAAGAVSYNVYKSDISYFGAAPTGVPSGFAGNCGGTTFVDSNITPDYSEAPPVAQDPFIGGSLISTTVTTASTYTTIPTAVTSGGSPVVQAILQPVLGVVSFSIDITEGGYAVGDICVMSDGVSFAVTARVSGGFVTAVQLLSPGTLTTGTVPSSIVQTSTTGTGGGLQMNVIWGVIGVNVTNPGKGYSSTPTVVFSAGSAAATANLGAAGTGPAGVPGFYQQRLVLAAPNGGPGTLNFSQPGNYYNFDTNNPIEPNDAINVSLVAGQLQTIKSVVPTAPGLIVFTDKASWLLNGGGLGSAVSPSSIVANQQSYNGANDVPPIINNYDILYVESKGSTVRDSTYNYYAQVFTGADISAVSSHLFFGYQVVEWAWAQEPFNVVWAVRNDGNLLSLTFKKEEDFIAWAHHNTQGGFKSVATVVEQIELPSGRFTYVDAVYVVVQRTINGNEIQYIERFADRYYDGEVANAWTVDAAIQFNGSPATTFSGAQQLAGASVTGLADGVVIPPFTMPVDGTFTLGTPASLVTVGLAFTPQLQTLPIDVGEPTIQGKQKKINAVTVRCVDTLGLSIGSSFDTLVPMKDLIVGNVGSQTNEVVTGLVTGDAFTIVDPAWAEQGQFCIEQPFPLPATVTGVIPQLAVGNTQK